MNTVERARGRWPEILRHLGIEDRFLRNKHGPCPNCGGKDRFRFDNKNGEGTFYCQQCGAGTGLILLRRLHGWDHKTACDEVDKVIGRDPPPLRTEPCRRNSNAKAAAIDRLLAVSSDDRVVADYLELRGISAGSPALIGRRACPYFDEDGALVGTFPAVLAPILAPDGTVVSVQRIWRKSDVGQADKKPMPPITEGALNGAAVRLHDCDDELAVAEGVMTALAAYELFGIPCWSTLSANGLKVFTPPCSVRKLIVYGDNDRKFAGQAAAYELARRMSTKPDPIECMVCIPDDPGTDWNDVLLGRTLQ